jgi:4'-phosphopantetheinyl transferase
VLSLRLDQPEGVLRELGDCLNEDEQARAARFRQDRDRNRFVAARGQLRLVLGRSLGIPPAQIQFAYGSHGKPELVGPAARTGLRFNLSHSEDFALVAVTSAGPVGIDVEHIRCVPEDGVLVSRFFSPREQAGFSVLPDDQKPAAFFKLWTRKEAWLKATGDGVAGGLDHVEVTFLPGEPARLLGIPEGRETVADWSLYDLAVPDGFTAALAVQSPEVRLSCQAFCLGRSATRVAPHPPYSG